VSNKLTWKVKRYDISANAIVDYDVLKYREDFIKKLKKKCADKEEFSEVLEREFRWRFWSKAEHELIIEVSIDRVILSPWCGCREPAKVAIDVTADPNFDWRLFAEYHLGRQGYGSKAKIDVWDQLAARFDELVDYCWYTRLPYERKHEKFEREPK
jgi:hypothetical protein